MKLLLLCLGLTLVCANDGGQREVETSNLDMSKISGEWYTIVLAGDVMEKIDENGSFRMFLESIELLDNSSLVFKFHKEVNGECLQLTFVCDETEEKGVYEVDYDGYNKFHIIEADFNDYIVFHLFNFDNGKRAQLMALKARNPDVSPQLKKRFEKLCENHGIPKENVLDLTNDNPCVQARESAGDQDSSAE